MLLNPATGFGALVTVLIEMPADGVIRISPQVTPTLTLAPNPNPNPGPDPNPNPGAKPVPKPWPDGVLRIARQVLVNHQNVNHRTRDDNGLGVLAQHAFILQATFFFWSVLTQVRV